MLHLSRLFALAILTSTLCLGCSHAQQSASNAAETANPAAVASAPPTIATPAAITATTPPTSFADIENVYGADKIEQLAQLGVFGPTNGSSFLPNTPILRRDFVLWAFNANNKLAKTEDKAIHPASPNDPSAFKDLKTTDPDFTEIQGMQNANISVGFPDSTFKPDEPITREQAVSIASLLSCAYTASFTGGNAAAGWLYLPEWKDKMSISKTYVPVLAGCADSAREIVGRAYGKILTFNPRRPVTRAEAALMLWEIDGRSAADVLEASPSPQGT